MASSPKQHLLVYHVTKPFNGHNDYDGRKRGSKVTLVRPCREEVKVDEWVDKRLEQGGDHCLIPLRCIFLFECMTATTP